VFDSQMTRTLICRVRSSVTFTAARDGQPPAILEGCAATRRSLAPTPQAACQMGRRRHCRQATARLGRRSRQPGSSGPPRDSNPCHLLERETKSVHDVPRRPVQCRLIRANTTRPSAPCRPTSGRTGSWIGNQSGRTSAYLPPHSSHLFDTGRLSGTLGRLTGDGSSCD
jgi:hypothetical protein